MDCETTRNQAILAVIAPQLHSFVANFAQVEAPMAAGSPFVTPERRSLDVSNATSFAISESHGSEDVEMRA